MTAGERDLERPPRLEEAPDLGKVGLVRRGLPAGRRRNLDRDHLRAQAGPVAADAAPAEDVGRLGQGCRPEHLDPGHEARLRDGGRRHDDPTGAAPRQRGHHRQEPGHGPDLAAQAELAQQGPMTPGADLLRADEHGDGDAEVQRGTSLRHVRRGKVDRDPARGMDEPTVAEGPADPLARLPESDVRQPDDREAGQPGGDVDLHAHGPAVEALEGGGEHACEHAPHGSDACSPAGYRCLIGGASARAGNGRDARRTGDRSAGRRRGR